jgi:Caspase domain
MSSPRRMAALAIGVSDAPPLPFLSGAVNGARAFHEWAQALGYESRLVTDEDEPVTAQRVRSELEALLPGDETVIHRLLVYFAGHGVIREVEEGLWLLSDWNHELRAVAVEALRRRLDRYGVSQVAFFADACRSLPADVDTADLTPDALLGKGPAPRSPTPPAVDKFIAAQDGTTTFMIPGADPDDDRCLFSGVLLEALWGTQQKAFSALLPGKVTSRSLGAFLQAEVSKVAEGYRLTLVPSWSSTFPEGDDVYFGEGPAVTPPVFPPWPPAEDLIALDGAVTGAELELRDVPEARRPDSLLEDQMRNQELPDPFELLSGFVVDGEAVVAIWTGPDVVAEAHGRPDWLRVRRAAGGPLDVPAPVLIELVSGLFAAATALPDFIASVVATDRGVAALVYREIYAQPTASTATEEAIVQLERGGLRADDATDLAAELRHEKHADPVRGVISAYLYDSIGDVESIRRMAFFYLQHDQAIPYDIALLAQLEGEKREDGLLWATVPAVPERAPRTEKESGLGWTHSATEQRTGVVGGFWPWLRQGWAFLDDPAEDGSTLVLPGLIEAADDLTPARFTTLHHSGARRLADAFGLRDSTPEGVHA